MNEKPLSPFVDLRGALLHGQAEETRATLDGSENVRIDPQRWRRTGIPEIVHAGTKSAVDVAESLRRLAQAQGRALASRVRPEHLATLRELLEPDYLVESFDRAGCVVAAQPGSARPVSGGVVGIVSAGSSDVPVAAEAALIAAEMGASVMEAWDVGVAGLHRLVEPLERFAANQVDAVVVAAGMDGALPSVVAGLVDVPVIGLPTSTGYGFGGEGLGALTTMLQSCAPGVVVVNIDNGIGAGAAAALIATRAARSRSGKGANALDDELDGLMG